MARMVLSFPESFTSTKHLSYQVWYGLHESHMQKKIIAIIGILFVLGVTIIVGAWYLQSLPHTYSGPPEPVIIATTPSLSSTLILIADSKGFFTRQGLNVTIQENPLSITSMDNLNRDTADIAGSSDYSFTNYLFTSPALQTFTSTAKTDVISIVARKDRGIAAPQDLAGKKIGCTKQQAGEFFLGRYLRLNSINSSSVTVVNVNPADMPGAMANGTIDATITWEPYVTNLKKQLGQNAVVFPAQEGQRYYWLLICTNKTASERPEMIKKVLAALVDAESFTQQNPEEAQQIVADCLHMDPNYIREVWPKYRLIVSLDQSLITAMEDEARWSIQNNLTSKREIPNYRSNIYRDALDAVKPQAVTVIR
jgi:NitT/TauT family transport system substrate-binding protein